jgi:large subunit ribosomal protein L28
VFLATGSALLWTVLRGPRLKGPGAEFSLASIRSSGYKLRSLLAICSEGIVVSRVCEKCGKKPVAGRKYARRGLAKYKGGVGRKVTGITKRTFSPNIQLIKVKEENGTVHRIRICAKCLKTGVRKGTILKASRKPRPPKKIVAPVAPPIIEDDEVREEDDLPPAEPAAEIPFDEMPVDDAPADAPEEASDEAPEEQADAPAAEDEPPQDEQSE